MKREKSAIMSACGNYRYMLYRKLDGPKGPVMFVMLNPSTADATHDDPTVRRCINFAKAWGHCSLYVGNLFAFRATDPKNLKTTIKNGVNPIGEDNDEHLVEMANVSVRMIAAWGHHGTFLGRDAAVRFLLNVPGNELTVLGFTKAGHPRHPLYLKKEAMPIAWSKEDRAE